MPQPIEIHADAYGTVRKDGMVIDTAPGGNPMIAVMAQLASAGRTQVVHVRDDAAGTEQWISIDPAGQLGFLPGPPVPENPAPVPSTSPSAIVQPRPVAEARFMNALRERPRSGLRGLVFQASGGHVNMGLSAREAEEQDLVTRIRRPFTNHHNTAVLSLKGGIGKTSTTVGVGLTIAEYRGEAPCVIDANPDSGDLAERALGEGLYDTLTSRTITDIVRGVDRIDSLTTLSDYLHLAGRLHVVAGEQDPALSDALTAQDYLKVQTLLARYYRVVLTDCGTGVSHPAMAGILSTSTNVVIVSGYAVSGARRANAALTWLREHGYEHLAETATVVITDKDQVSSRVNRQAIEETLGAAAASIVTVPHDRKVADGDVMSLDGLHPQTRRAYLRIAAAVIDGYTTTR